MILRPIVTRISDYEVVAISSSTPASMGINTEVLNPAVAMQQGDKFGLYFPYSNPISYDRISGTTVCYVSITLLIC